MTAQRKGDALSLQDAGRTGRTGGVALERQVKELELLVGRIRDDLKRDDIPGLITKGEILVERGRKEGNDAGVTTCSMMRCGTMYP